MAIISGKSLAYINDICIGGGWMNTRGLGAHYAGRARLYGERLQFIRDRGGASLRLNEVNPKLLEPGYRGQLKITAPCGTIPEHLIGLLKTNGAIVRGQLDIGKLGELFGLRYAFRKSEDWFYLRAGEEMNCENMMRAVIGRLAGQEALVPKYGPLEGRVIDAVHTLYSTVQSNDGYWHPPLGEWNDKKAFLDDRGIMIDLAGFDLARLDLAGLNLRNMDFTGAIFDRSDLSEADLSFSVLKQISAPYVDFRGAFLMSADFSHSLLMRADFEDAAAFGARFSGAELMMANIFRAILIGAQFDGNWHLFEGDMRYNIENRNRGRINGYLGYLTALSSSAEGIGKLKTIAEKEYEKRELLWGRTEEDAARSSGVHFRFMTPASIVEFLIRAYADGIVERELGYSFRGEPLPTDAEKDPVAPLELPYGLSI